MTGSVMNFVYKRMTVNVIGAVGPVGASANSPSARLVTATKVDFKLSSKIVELSLNTTTTPL